MVPESHRVGEEGKGFSYLLDSLNPERILIAAEALGIAGQPCSAVDCGQPGSVGRPIGGAKHPASAGWEWIELEAAELLIANGLSL